MMHLKPNMRVLDVGCGVGGPAREICRFSDANVTGVNNNDFQIQRANKKTRKAGLSEKISYAKGDFMKLSKQFGEGSFDAGERRFQEEAQLLPRLKRVDQNTSVYAIEATCHAPSFEGIYSEIYKVLKPGGTVGDHTAARAGTDRVAVWGVRMVHDG